MTTEQQVGVTRRWVGPVVGMAMGAVAGWVLGRAVTMSPATGMGAPVLGYGVALGVVVLGTVTVVLALVAAAAFMSPKRRSMSVATAAAAAGWIAGYAVAMWMV
jgi:hypothetical protein